MADTKTTLQQPIAREHIGIVAAQKVLFLAQLPPPLHGASAMSQRAHDGMSARGDLDLTHLWLGSAASNQDVGQRSLGKLLAFLRFVVMLLWQVVRRRRYAIGYLTLAPFAHAALRDGILIALSKLLARRTIVHLHALGIDAVMTGTAMPQRILRRCIRGVELITLTAKDAAAMRATGHFKAVHLLPNGIEDPGEPPFTATATLRCGYLANLDPRKGVLRFLDCMAALRQAGLPVTGRIAGDETAYLTRFELAAEVQRRGLDGTVEVLGPLYGDQKTGFLAASDLFVYLSAHDYSPLVVIEAMAGGAVPIVFDVEGQRELLGQPFAANVLAPDLTAAELSGAVTDIVRRYHDDPARLLHDRTAARARYISGYTAATFHVGLNAILDAR